MDTLPRPMEAFNKMLKMDKSDVEKYSSQLATAMLSLENLGRQKEVKKFKNEIHNFFVFR